MGKPVGNLDMDPRERLAALSEGRGVSLGRTFAADRAQRHISAAIRHQGQPAPRWPRRTATRSRNSSAWARRNWAVPRKNPTSRRVPRGWVEVPRLPLDASAGPGAFAARGTALRYLPFLRTLAARAGLEPGQLAAIRVMGDSMDPLLRDGDEILVDRTPRPFRDGRACGPPRRCAARQVAAGDTPGQLRLISKNVAYEPVEVSMADVNIVGRVVWKGAGGSSACPARAAASPYLRHGLGPAARASRERGIRDCKRCSTLNSASAPARSATLQRITGSDGEEAVQHIVECPDSEMLDRMARENRRSRAKNWTVNTRAVWRLPAAETYRQTRRPHAAPARLAVALAFPRRSRHPTARARTPNPAHARRDRAGHPVPAELLADLVHEDDARRAGRSRRRSRQAQGRGRARRGDAGEDPRHPRPCRSLRAGGHAGEGAGPADRGAARGRPVLDRPARGRRPRFGTAHRGVRARPLAARTATPSRSARSSSK